MHLAIIYDNADVAGVRTCQRSMLHTIHDTLQDSWHETGIDSSTNHRVEEYQLATPLQGNFFAALDVHLELLTIEGE